MCLISFEIFFRKVMKLTGQAKLLKIYVGEAVQHQGKDVAQLIVNLLKANRVAGATLNRGIIGLYYGWKTSHNIFRQDLSCLL